MRAIRIAPDLKTEVHQLHNNPHTITPRHRSRGRPDDNPDKLKVKKMETSSKASKAARQFVAFLTASVTLAIATFVSASTSTQVKQLDPLVVPRTAHVA